MELGEFIKNELERLQQGINRATNDLTPAELKWQPNPEGNPIGFLLYHIARTEDRFVQRSLLGKPPIFMYSDREFLLLFILLKRRNSINDKGYIE